MLVRRRITHIFESVCRTGTMCSRASASVPQPEAANTRTGSRSTKQQSEHGCSSQRSPANHISSPARLILPSGTFAKTQVPGVYVSTNGCANATKPGKANLKVLAVLNSEERWKTSWAGIFWYWFGIAGAVAASKAPSGKCIVRQAKACELRFSGA